MKVKKYSLSSEMFPSEESSEAFSFSWVCPPELWSSVPEVRMCSVSSFVGLSWWFHSRKVEFEQRKKHIKDANGQKLFIFSKVFGLTQDQSIYP